MTPFSKRGLGAACLLAAVALLLVASTASAAVTQKQAAARAIDALGVEARDDAVIVFGLPKPVRAGTKVTQAGTGKPGKGSKKGLTSKLRRAGVRTVRAPGVITARTRSYFFYEDRGPFQLYQHPGRVAIVDVATGRVRVSRTITWPPLLNRRLPAFLRSAARYRSAKYQAFYRPWSVPAGAQQPRVAQRNLFDLDPFGPGKPLPNMANAKAIADRLAAERSCVLRVSDTLPSFWNANELNLTRSYVGTLFEALERQNGGFVDDRYGARSGETLGQAVDRLVALGCKDILLYIAGQGYDQDGEPVIHLGTSVRPGGLLAQQNISAGDLRNLVSARPGVTFKFKFDVPYSGGMIDRLRDLANVLLIETPAAAGEGAFAFIPSVSQGGQMVSDQANPAGLLSFTNCELVGLKAFFDSAEEIDKATQAQTEGVSFLAEMLARSQELCKGVGFADDLGASPQLYAAKRGSGQGTNRPNRPPVANAQAVEVTEDEPKDITLTASDPDGDAITFQVTANPAHGTLSGTAPNLTYTPDPNYTGPDSFQFKVTDPDGASDTETVSITVKTENDAPVVTTSSGCTAYAEQGAAVEVDGGLTVADLDDAQLEGATVRIAANFEPGDELDFVDQNGISDSYNTGTGVLTLTGSASVSDYQAALRSVRYRNPTDESPPATKTIEFRVDDGDSQSAAATKQVCITAVNDTPVVDTTDTALSYTEGDGARPVDDGITVTDPDSANLVGATIQITGNFSSAEDDLSFAPQFGITGSYDDTTGTLTLSGTASVADYQAALRDVRYVNSSESPSTATRTVSFQVDDGAASSNVATRDIQVTPVDDTAAANDDSQTVDEDASATAIDVLANDTEGEGGPNTISSATDPANGTVVLTGGSPGAHTGLTYQPDPNYCNDPPGTTPDTFTYTINGGDTATVSVTVTCVNDAPLADDETFGGNDSAHGNTTMQVDDPDDDKSAPTHPHTEITGDILAGDTDVDGPGPMTVLPGTFATNDGGSVTLEPDGDFVFHPAAATSCTDTSDFFDYTVEDSGAPEQTDTGRVTIEIAGCVWYVSNDAAGDSGTAAAPFDTLAQAETASGNDHTVFVFDGDDTALGYHTGFALNSGERLIGEHEGLTVDPDQGGALAPDSLHPPNPGAHPTITATNEDVIALDDGNAVHGIQIEPNGAFNGIAGASGDTGTTTIDDVRIIDTGVAATDASFELAGTTGTFNVSNLTINNTGATAQSADSEGVELSGAGTVNFAGSGTNSITVTGAKGLDAAGTDMGTSTFDDVTVSNSSDGGVSLFDTTGATTFGDGSGTDLSLTTASGAAAAFRVHNGGSVSVGSAGDDNLHATGGPAVDVSATSGPTLEFDDVDSTNSANDGINLDGLGTGTFSASSGDISGAAGVSFDVNGGSGAITYPGAFGNGSGSTAFDITGRSGGVVSLSGGISDTNDPGGQLNVSGNTGGSTILSGATKQFDTGATDAVDFQSSDGHTLVLSGGGTDIDTTSGRGIDAEASGTIEVSGSGNTVATDTGRGVNVVDTTIGAADMTLQSVHVNSDQSGSGPDFGIRLVNTGTGGNLAVTGTGGACQPTSPVTNCTGGTIHDTTSDGVRIDDSHNASISRMNVTESDGTGVYVTGGSSGSTFSNMNLATNGNAVAAAGAPDAGFGFTDLAGTTTITGDTFVRSSRNNQVDWQPTTGAQNLVIDDANIENGGQGPSTGAWGISVVATGGQPDLLVDGGAAATSEVLIDNHPSGGMLTAAQGTSHVKSEVDNADLEDGNVGIQHNSSADANTTFRINDSDLEGFGVAPNDQGAGSTIAFNPVGTSDVDGTITNNRIGVAGVPRSGGENFYGIVGDLQQSSDSRLNVSNNTVQETAQRGIWIFTADFDASATPIDADVTLRDNVVGNISNDDDVPFTNLNGIVVQSGDDSNLCLDIENNDSSSVGSSSTTGTELRTRQLDTSIFRLERLPVDSNQETVVEAFLNVQNPLIPLVEIDAQVTTQYTAAANGECEDAALP